MDLDRYLATHRPSWERLAQLTSGKRRRTKSLSTVQINEIIGLYQQASTDLSYIRTYHRDPSLISHLTRVVRNAGSVVYGTKPRTWRNGLQFFAVTFPAAMHRSRRFIALSAFLLFAPALAMGIWVAGSPKAVDTIMPPAAREAYINHDFEDYYATSQASQFASDVYTNNVEVGIMAFAGGLLLGIPTVISLVQNGALVGASGGIFAYVGQLPKFFGLITPHGMLELTSVVIAGAAGLQLGWSLIDPGDRSRRSAFAEEGQRAIVMILGLIVTFGIAGFIEGFVTGQPWPTWLRVGIGATAELGFLFYAVKLGRRASRAGFTGALHEHEQTGWQQL